MLDESQPPSPSRAVVALIPTDPDWRPIFQVSNQVVLYNPTSHALSIRHAATSPGRLRSPCPYCKQPLPTDFEAESDIDENEEWLDIDGESGLHSRASDYFHLLAIANETLSRPSTPPPIAEGSNGSRRGNASFPAEAMAEGYFKAFFQEEAKLGMGANGSVFLCQHMLDGNPLGHFAVKKIAVGDSHSYLLNILREVRLLERLHHPNIVTYHHAWLETCQFSPFGPKVPTLHLLMQWAEGGSLDDFIDARLGRETKSFHVNPLTPFTTDSTVNSAHITSASPSVQPSDPMNDTVLSSPGLDGQDGQSRAARIRAFRAYQRASPEEKERIRRQMGVEGGRRQTWTAIHLLSAEEVNSLFKDVVEGLAFLHDKAILHLDLKPGNVLLTWDEGRLIPRGMLSDFGTSRDMINPSGIRTGNTGTLEYASPESLPSPQTGLLKQVDSKSDMWSLGMILHKLLFFKLPYQYAASGDENGETVAELGESEKMDRLEQEVLNYPGFRSSQTLTTAFETRRLPRAFLVLLESLLHPIPSNRPSCERVSTAIREGMLNPLKEGHRRHSEAASIHSLIPVVRRPSNERNEHSPETHNQHEGQGQPATVAHVDAAVGDDNEEGRRTPLPSLRETKPDDKEPKMPPLGLPGALAADDIALSPPIAIGRRHLALQSQNGLGVWTIGGKRTVLKLPSSVRIIKSVMLVVKVLDVTLLMCPNTHSNVPNSYALMALLWCAVLDTWYDGLWLSLTLGVIHLAVRWGCTGEICCR